MRSLKLAAAVVAALALVPAAASATTYEGTCDDITGTAKFAKPLTGTKGPNSYDFNGTAHCTGKVNGKAMTDEPVAIHVAGPGNLGCSSGESTDKGKGTITVKSTGVVIDFLMTFTATLTEVDIKLEGLKSGTGTGQASFFNRADPLANLTTAQKCEGEGNTELSFTASASTDTPFDDGRSASAPASSGGGQPSGGGEPSGGGGSGSTDQPTTGSSQPDTTTSQEPGAKSQPNKKKSKKKSKKPKKKSKKKKSKKSKKKGKKRG